MILRLALRSLLTHPIRTLVLACGFGLGVGVMAMLLGVGEVILDQARSPAVSGGGDVVIASSTGDLPSSRWILSSALRTGGFEKRIAAASPSRRATLYLVSENEGSEKVGSGFRRTVDTTPIRTTAGIPSLERAIGDPETSSITAWTDAASDAAWSSPDPGAALAALDRFHPIPDVAARAESWAEWLYFNGQAGDNQFYLTFMVGAHRAGVRLQLDRAGTRTSYSQAQDVNDADVLSSAPNLTIGSNSVRLDGMRYHIALDLPAENGKSRITGDLVVEASPGRALPPLEIRGAGGWVSGYVVPVMSGGLSGKLMVDGAPIAFGNGAGYHDHNWGFWKDVSWRWGQVHHGDLSFVYGRVRPPADAADPERIPGFLAAIGPDGPVGYATNVSIEETNDPVTGRPRSITVRGRSSSLDVTMELAIEDAIVTSRGGRLFDEALDFLQLRARYRVRGRAGDRSIDFTASGAAETFRPGR
ncbi:MAG TPA: hypothetical protein VM115_12485 [Vicinamibacterales bacterium]|nr:hypothetical protein [Vicinamibacterales bacterium]